MADEYFKFEFDDNYKELQSYFKKFDERFTKIVIQELGKFGLRVEEVAKALAPRDSGDLEDSINTSKVIVEGKTFSITIGTNMKYALRVHEQPESKGVRPKYQRGVKYPEYYKNGRGENTRNKPNVNGYKPGRKYLTNAVKVTEDDWNIMCERILARVLEG
ncbi:HK97 gp10 family phage protein [Macrococcoides caseolyticum]|uniref:HK97 gp10 family phage protein n=1 Tax=Macrococcoides caseolyticum TaxID=69966 RepID=UPI0012FE8D98|nr:HK97 gp10 family phage protein [Macrococcus caseolyticus]